MLSPPTEEQGQRRTTIEVRRCPLFVCFRLFSLLFYFGLYCCLTVVPLSAQGRIVVGSIDTSSYPIVRGEIFFPGSDGRVQGCSTNLSGLRLQENGIDCPILDLQCSPYIPSPRLSSLLLIDRSTSMSEWDPEFRLVRWGAEYWADATLGTGLSECAISFFDATPWLVRDFSRDPSELHTAINTLGLGVDTTSYATAFLERSSGALSLLRPRSGRRLVILLTDGGGWGTEEAIIRRAEEADVVICALVVGRDAGDLLRGVSARTGGRCFDRITTLAEMQGAIVTIIKEIAERSVCRISWQSQFDCSRSDRTVTITCQPSGDVGTAIYSAPIDRSRALVVDPESIEFGSVEMGSYRDTMAVLGLTNSSSDEVTIHDVRIEGEDASVFVYDAGPLPITLAASERHPLRLRFAPDAIGRSIAHLFVEHDGSCLQTIIRLQGDGTGGAVRIPLLHAAPGDRFLIPLLLDAPRTLRRDQPSIGFRAIIGFNRRLLIIGDSIVPGIALHDTALSDTTLSNTSLSDTTLNDTTLRGIPIDKRSHRTIIIEGRWDVTSDTIVTLSATAALAEATATPLAIIDFHWLDDDGREIACDVARQDGRFWLDDICHVGAGRLVREVDPSWLRILPTDPVAAHQALLEFQSNVDEPIIITLDDRSGRRLALLFNGPVRSQEVQSLTINTQALPSGLYRCTMQSATQRLGVWMMVVR